MNLVINRIVIIGLWLVVGLLGTNAAHSQNFFPIAIANASAGMARGDDSRTYSVGRPHLGALLNPIQLDESVYFTVRAGRNFGTPELVDVLEAAGRDVHARHGASPKVHVGDLSFKHGGPIGRHVSHQSGRDADVSYYLKSGHDPNRFRKATADNIDAARTWTFFEALLLSGHTEIIFSDRRLLKVLRAEAESRPDADMDRIKTWFDGDPTAPGRRPVLRHLKGHANHLHLRVHAPQSAISVAALGEGKRGSKARQTIALAHEFRTKRAHPSVADTGCDHDGRENTPQSVHGQAALVQDPSLDPGFETEQLEALLTAAKDNTKSPASRARQRARRARTRARQARRRARTARTRWYQRHPERLAQQP
ncbi:MAG: penicillin-insensitive murein endopeptidase [Myxococcota bacterium]|nr:penicillin-insensitive murein endopeptidase [Myxococcota bacterium]